LERSVGVTLGQAVRELAGRIGAVVSSRGQQDKAPSSRMIGVSASGTRIRRWLGAQWRKLAIAALLPIVGLVGLLFYGVPGHGDPDPDGQTLIALKSVETALPPFAVDVSRQYVEAVWDSCDGRPGTFGWSDIGVYLTFGTAQENSVVVAYVTARLESIGWTGPEPRTTTTASPGEVLSQTSSFRLRFVRTLANGVDAVARLDAWTPDGQTITWSLTAIAPPQGPRASGC
jgi:hypothetical protein